MVTACPSRTWRSSRGWAATRSTLARWNAAPWPVLRAGWLVASSSRLAARGDLGDRLISTPDPTRLPRCRPEFARDPPTPLDVLGRNSLVLALHSFACLAGFIAGISLPLEARRYTGSRAVHDKAGPLAIAFVVVRDDVLARHAGLRPRRRRVDARRPARHRRPARCCSGLLPHALPELIALFLPLAAWIVASRRGDWDELLAATFVTTLLAAPVLVLAAAASRSSSRRT